MNNSGNNPNQNADLPIDLQSKEARNSPALVDKFVIRLPQGLRDQIKELSEHNRRSMNSEIIMVLEQHIQQYAEPEEISEPGAEFREAAPLTDQELDQKLKSLPPEKKEALLSLLT